MFMPDHPTARALLAFRAAHGRRWKAKLLFLWSTGRDVEEADGACPRQRRNQAGPAWLNQLSPYRWRAIGRLAEPGDRQTASIFLDRAREFHEGARLGAAVALAPALHLLAIFRAGARSLSYEPGLVERGGGARDVRHDLSPPATKRGDLASRPRAVFSSICSRASVPPMPHIVSTRWWWMVMFAISRPRCARWLAPRCRGRRTEPADADAVTAPFCPSPSMSMPWFGFRRTAARDMVRFAARLGRRAGQSRACGSPRRWTGVALLVGDACDHHGGVPGAAKRRAVLLLI